MRVIVPEVLILITVAHQWEDNIMDKGLKKEKKLVHTNYLFKVTSTYTQKNSPVFYFKLIL